MTRQKPRVRFDVLAWKPARAVLLSPAFPVALQAAALAGLVWLAAAGLGVGPGRTAEELLTLRKTSIATLVVWGLWWPVMIAAALALGRVWCTVCPMELVNRAGDALARRAGWPRARLGRFLRAGWVVLAAYLVLQLLVAGISIHRVPHYTSMFLAALLGCALTAGLVFRDSRSFCRAFCPAGALLSVYGRYTPLQIEARDPAVCKACPTRDCVRAANRRRFDKRSCPSLLVPFQRRPSDGCVLCFQCAKVCPYGNMGFGWVEPDAPVRRNALLRPLEAAFVMVALGFVAHEVIAEVKWLDRIFHMLPAWLHQAAPAVAFGWFEALWFLVLFPLLAWAGIAAAAFLAGHRGPLGTLLAAAATGAAPVVAAAHLAKAVAKAASWGGFLPLAVRDPRGVDTFQAIAGRAMEAPPALLEPAGVGWVMLPLTLVVAWRAMGRFRQMPHDTLAAARSGLAVTCLLFTLVLAVWTLPVRWGI